MADDRVRLPNARRISFQPVMALGLDGTELIAVIASGFLIMAGSLVVTVLVIQVLHFSMLMSAGAGLYRGIRFAWNADSHQARDPRWIRLAKGTTDPADYREWKHRVC